jgi:single-strand DNA-binding protein
MANTFSSFDITGRVSRTKEFDNGVTKINIESRIPGIDKDGQPSARSSWNTVTVFANHKSAIADIAENDLIQAKGLVSKNSYEKDGQRHYTTDLVVSRIGVLAKATAANKTPSSAMENAEFHVLARVGRVATFDNGVTRTSVASNSYDVRDGETIEYSHWNEVTVFNKDTSRFMTELVKPGDLMYMRGRIETRSYEANGDKKYSTELIATQVDRAAKGPNHEIERAGGRSEPTRGAAKATRGRDHAASDITMDMT